MWLTDRWIIFFFKFSIFVVVVENLILWKTFGHFIIIRLKPCDYSVWLAIYSSFECCSRINFFRAICWGWLLTDAFFVMLVLCHRHKKLRAHQLLIRISFPTAHSTTQFCLSVNTNSTFSFVHVASDFVFSLSTLIPCNVLIRHTQKKEVKEFKEKREKKQQLSMYELNKIDKFLRCSQESVWSLYALSHHVLSTYLILSCCSCALK